MRGAVAGSLGLTLAVSMAATRPQTEIANQTFPIATSRGAASLPIMVSLDWSRPQPGFSRAVIIFHGVGRDVTGYYRTLQEAAAQAGRAAQSAILIAPQFLNEQDAREHHLPAEFLRWPHSSWEGGAPASGRLSASSYDVVDALVTRLADRALFPDLKTVVLAGHSGGGQLVQRYAIVGRATAALASAGVQIRFVVANPSSYLYFSDERPVPSRCRDFDRWKYGPLGPPPYVKNPDWSQLETGYAQRDVIYLLGTADTDPHEKDLDTSCAGEAQGPTRFARGQAYFAYLHARHTSGWNQRMWFVPGVAHSAHRMFTSICGVDALFDTGVCANR